MEMPSSRLQIILAYNTPDDLPVEAAMRSFQTINASFTALRVPGSRSKAENIIAALPLCRGEMIALLDADHHPLPDAFPRAYRWLQRGYDVVQGRCVVRNQRASLLSRIVAVEFEQIYAVAHAGRSLATDSAIFGGTNGYWRTEVLRRIAMDPHMLTEDIDASTRAMLAGHRLVHDRSIISTELATTTLRTWWHQRLRWAQGWLQVTLRHQLPLLRTSRLPVRTKLNWTYLLAWRELFPFLSLQIFALLAGSAVLRHPIPWLGNPYFAGTALLTVVTGPAISVATYRVALWRTKRDLRWWFVVYAILHWPYTILKNTVAMVAMIRQAVGERTWVVTRRSTGHGPGPVAARNQRGNASVA
jgi:cellulose synthase/poly-beta-1,6-N-acetylglucosamine synthase-like glycosyltransferase